jgi:hypothetical protein
MFNPPAVVFTPDAFYDISAIVRLHNEELNFYGVVDRIGHLFLVSKIYLPKQVCGPVTTEADTCDLQGLIDEAGADADRLQFWGHSHVDMQVSPSHVDLAQWDEYSRNSPDYFIGAIFNKRGEARTDVYLRNEGVVVRDTLWALEKPDHTERDKRWRAEIDAKVSQPAHTPMAAYTGPLGSARYRGETSLAMLTSDKDDFWADLGEPGGDRTVIYTGGQ